MVETGLPLVAGVGFKPEHFADLAAAPPAVGFLEIHAENYLGAGGSPHAQLARLRQDHALSIHGVGLSIGGEEPLDAAHLARLRHLCDRYQPESFSEHLAWSSHGGVFYNDLLPLALNTAALTRVCAHIDAVQMALGRRMLLENPATYLQFDDGMMAEVDFLAEVARRTGCGLLLDVNNVFVSATNHHFDPHLYLAAFPLDRVGEIHLAGHQALIGETGEPLLLDSHDGRVAPVVWQLYAEVIARTGPLPTLIEWDNDVPAWDVLRGEAVAADRFLRSVDRQPTV